MNNEKRTTIEESVAALEPGGRVLFNSAASFPVAFAEGMASEGSRLKGTTVHHAMRREPRPLTTDYLADPAFVHVSDFVFDESIRAAVQQGRAHYRPNHPHEGPRTLADTIDSPFVFVSAASPPDRHGYFSLGPFGGWGISFLRQGPVSKVILEVNPQQPRIHGDAVVHISEVDGWYEVDYAIKADALSGDPSPSDTAIADLVTEFIDDGSTLQFGAGVVPDQIAKRLIDSGARNLGIHSEAIFDSVVGLVEAGVVDGSRKSRDKGRLTFSMGLGSGQLFDFLDDNRVCNMQSMTYVNDPAVIATNHQQIAINAAIQVDLLGQVASETLGPSHYSGTGGQWEFNYGAAHSSGGHGIVVLPSTAKDGTLSTITAGLPAATPVTIPRNDTDVVVTEHGVAHLKGRTVPERARGLIAIAAPEFREQLERAAHELRLM